MRFGLTSCLKTRCNFAALMSVAEWFPSALSNLLHWGLDSNADSHDTYTRLISGQPRIRDYSTTGTRRDLQPGLCGDFDGTDDHVAYSDVSLTGDFTLACHVIFDATDNMLWGQTGSSKNYIWMQTTSLITVRVNATNYNVTLDLAMSLGAIYHIAIVRDSGVVSVYVDGVAQTTTHLGVTGTFTTNTFGRYVSGIYFDGKAWGNGIWDSALSAANVSSLAANELDVSGASLFYKFEDKAGELVQDSSGNNNHGTANGVTLGTWRDETVNDQYSHWNQTGGSIARYFDGTDDYVDCDTRTGTANTTMSVALRFCVPTTRTPNADTLFGEMTSGGFWGKFLLRLQDATTIRVGWNNTVIEDVTVSAINDAQWHTLVVTRTGTDGNLALKIYLDGTEISSTTETTLIGSSTSKVSIGRSGEYTVSSQAQALISDVMLFDGEAISAANVTWYDTAGSSGTDPGTTNLEGHWKLNDESTTVATDSSSNGNDGTYNGPAIALIPRDESDTTKDITGAALQFTGRCPVEHDLSGIPCLDLDGTDDYIDCGDSDDFSFGDGLTDSPFSIACIVDFDSLAVGDDIIGKYTNPYEYVVQISSSTLYFFLRDDSAAGYIGRSATLSGHVTANQLFSLVCTYDGSGLSSGVKIYADGVQIDDADFASGSYTAMENTTAPLRFGAATNGHDGKLGDVRLYSDELTAAEALWHYDRETGTDPTTANLVGHWPLEEGPGSPATNVTVYDVSSNGNDGTITNATVATVWSTRDKGPAYTVENGCRLSAGVRIPAKADGSAAADDNALTNGPGALIVGDEIADPTQGNSNIPELQQAGLNTSVQVGDSTAFPNYARDDATQRDRLIITEAAPTGGDLTNLNDYIS